MSGRQFHVDESVPGINADGDDPAFADVGEILERGFFNRSLLRREENETGLLPGRVFAALPGFGQDADQRGDGFARFEFQDVGDAPSFGGAAHVGNFVDAFDIHAPGVGKEHQVIVGAGREKVLDEIAVLLGLALARGHADDAFAAAALGAVGTDVGPLDQAGVGDGDDDAFVRDEVFNGDLAFVGHDLAQARRGVFLFDLLQFLFDDGHHALFFCEDIEEVFDFFEQLGVFLFDLVDFQAGEAVKLQFENGIHLPLGEGVEAVDQARV